MIALHSEKNGFDMPKVSTNLFLAINIDGLTAIPTNYKPMTNVFLKLKQMENLLVKVFQRTRYPDSLCQIRCKYLI